MARKFLLCFHDFSVWNFRKVTPVIENLRDLVGAPFSVLVIPDTDTADEKTVNDFRDTLKQLHDEGFELALHGFKHKAEFSQGRSYRGLVGMSLTHGEAEFAGLSEYESNRLLQQGLAAWDHLLNNAQAQKAAIKPAAFVPPTWYSNKFLPRQVRASGLLYEDRTSLTTSKGKRYISPVASFAGIPSFMMKPAFKFGELMLKVPVCVPRIALHPVDFPDKSAKIHDLIRTALNCGRKITLYKDL